MSTAVRERPILFSGPMVRAILEGRKTQTRRVVKLTQFQPSDTPGYDWTFRCRRGLWQDYRNADFLAECCPHGRVGDRLWGREAWADAMCDGGPVICYRADMDRRYLYPDSWPIDYDRYPGCKFANWASDLEGGVEGHWRPSIHMPRWASRITLEITGVRVERLREIGEEDARAEGAVEAIMGLDGPAYDRAEKAWCRATKADDPDAGQATARGAFFVLWDTINGKSHPWSSNPWVWVIEFRRADA